MTYVQYKIALELSFLGRPVEALTATDVAIDLMGEDGADGGAGWLAATSQHWNLDRPDPR
jgi:hypothetical protein